MSVAIKTYPDEKQKLYLSFSYASCAINGIKQISKAGSGLTEVSRVENIGKIPDFYSIQEVEEKTNAIIWIGSGKRQKDRPEVFSQSLQKLMKRYIAFAKNDIGFGLCGLFSNLEDLNIAYHPEWF